MLQRERPILVIDDEPAILETVCDILIDEGYTVETAGDGAEALLLLDRLVPALILLDMRMPGINGWELGRRLAKRGSTIPIVVMTAAQDASRWATEIGAAAVLAKPFNVQELISIVERLYTPTA